MVEPTPRLYVYVVVNKRHDPPAPVHVALSRQEARKWMEWQADPSTLTLRRARATIY